MKPPVGFRRGFTSQICRFPQGVLHHRHTKQAVIWNFVVVEITDLTTTAISPQNTCSWRIFPFQCGIKKLIETVAFFPLIYDHSPMEERCSVHNNPPVFVIRCIEDIISRLPCIGSRDRAYV